MDFTCAEAVASEDREDWIIARIRMFDLLYGVPTVVVLDNLKSAAFSADLFHPALNRTDAEMASHDGTATMPDPNDLRSPWP